MPARYLLIAGTFLLSMLLYVDRVCISIAEGEIREQLDFNSWHMGFIFGAFTLGYALFQTPSGIIADRFGPRRLLTAVVCLWSLFTALTGAVRYFIPMLVVRFLFGVGEAGAFPGMARAIYTWLPTSERGVAHGINFSASRLGAAVAMPAVAILIIYLGWRNTFFLLGGIGFLWAGAWYWWFRDSPEEHGSVSPEERAFIVQHRQQESAAAKEPVQLDAKVMFSSVNMWLLMGQYFASNFTFFFSLSWLIPFLRSGEEKLSLIEAGWYAMPVFLSGMAGNWVSGLLVDGIYRRGNWQRSRQLPAMIGFLLAAGGMAATAAVPITRENATLIILCLSITVFGADMTLSPSWSLCVDIGRKNSGAVSGTMNMAGNIGSFVTALAYPVLYLWSGSRAPFFLVAAALSLVAIVGWKFIRADRPLEEY